MDKNILLENIKKFQNKKVSCPIICIATIDENEEFCKAVLEYYKEFNSFPIYLLTALANNDVFMTNQLEHIDKEKLSFAYEDNSVRQVYDFTAIYQVIFRVFDRFFRFTYSYDLSTDLLKEVFVDSIEELFSKQIKAEILSSKDENFVFLRKEIKNESKKFVFMQ